MGAPTGLGVCFLTVHGGLSTVHTHICQTIRGRGRCWQRMLGGTRVIIYVPGDEQSACTVPTEVLGIGTCMFCTGATYGVIL